MYTEWLQCETMIMHKTLKWDGREGRGDEGEQPRDRNAPAQSSQCINCGSALQQLPPPPLPPPTPKSISEGIQLQN